MLLCFFDMNQRPSRHCTSQLVEQIEHLKERGVTIIAVQASKVEENELQEWITQSNIPFTVGRVQGHDENICFTWGIKSLPWLILAGKDQVVLAEGFALDELGGKIAQNATVK